MVSEGREIISRPVQMIFLCVEMISKGSEMISKPLEMIFSCSEIISKAPEINSKPLEMIFSGFAMNSGAPESCDEGHRPSAAANISGTLLIASALAAGSVPTVALPLGVDGMCVSW